jgi:glucose/arabinose dehydrogenase
VSRRRSLAGAAAGLAVAVALAVVVNRRGGPDYEAIRGCTLPAVAPGLAVDIEAAALGGIELVPVAEIERSTALVPWRDGRRVVLATRDGEVWLMEPDGQRRLRILDLTERTALMAEGGLIGLAVAPDGSHLYVHHTDLEGTSHILELRTTTDGVDVSSERELLAQEHPAQVHNGGAMTFGPDGYLYFGFGDGGGRPADAARVASLEELDGKVLRIDPAASGDSPYTIPDDNPFVDDDGARPEIWLTGMRNPYRLSFDARTGDLWIGDVGEACYEEINVLEAGRGGEDLGFPRFEGTHEFLGGEIAGALFPIFTYTHDEGCALIAGSVVRDPALPALDGRFVYSDYCAGGIRWLQRSGERVMQGSLAVAVEGVQSFGTGPSGEVYVLTAARVLRLSPAG